METSLTFLRYVRDAGHPLYAGLQIPDIETFGAELTGLSRSASEAASLREDPLLRATETKLESSRNGASLLVSPSGTSYNTATQVGALVGTRRRAKGARAAPSDAAVSASTPVPAPKTSTVDPRTFPGCAQS